MRSNKDAHLQRENAESIARIQNTVRENAAKEYELREAEREREKQERLKKYGCPCGKNKGVPLKFVHAESESPYCLECPDTPKSLLPVEDREFTAMYVDGWGDWEMLQIFGESPKDAVYRNLLRDSNQDFYEYAGRITKIEVVKIEPEDIRYWDEDDEMFRYQGNFIIVFDDRFLDKAYTFKIHKTYID